MSRQSMAPARNLSLTEELERLEQSITLTLQEIDHNFSRAHRIVTTSILPIVEQYGKHSEAVWEGSKFWKQFFEASANVSLSGYEEASDDTTAHEETQDSQLYDDETVEDTVTGATSTPQKPTSSHVDDELEDTSILDSPSLAHSHSTPRAPHTEEDEPQFTEYDSPYETLKRSMQSTSRTPVRGEFNTPAKTQVLPDMENDPESSPFALPTTAKKVNKDPLLHRVLDKTYRVAATPLSSRKYKPTGGFTPATAHRGIAAMSKWTEDSSPPSSPAPQLRADIFSSPMKAPRTPGVSVQTPGRHTQAFDVTNTKGIFDSDSEEDDEMGFSPPKTMQFHIPQSRLLQTPAREASRRIVEDLLMTAGGDITESTGDDKSATNSTLILDNLSIRTDNWTAFGFGQTVSVLDAPTPASGGSDDDDVTPHTKKAIRNSPEHARVNHLEFSIVTAAASELLSLLPVQTALSIYPRYTMPKDRRPLTSGYARIAQAEEEEDSHDESDDGFRQNSLSNSQYAPIQPKRNSRMQVPGGSGNASPNARRSAAGRRGRSNSGVDIKAINARLERWAEEIAQKFKIKKHRDKSEDETLEIHHSVFQAPDDIRPATAETLTFDFEGSADRITKLQFDDAVEGVRLAIEMGTHPLLISQGSSGSYFARNTQGKIVGVFKPKDEEPYASRNPKWTKWIHRNLFPFFFGRACLIPNLSYISEAAAYVLDTQLRTNIVPYTDIVSFSSKSFHYDFWDRRAFYRKKKPFPEKVGSFQIFLKGFKDANIFLKEHPWPDQHNSNARNDARQRRKRRWAEECRPSGPQSDLDDDDDSRPNTADVEQRRSVFWTPALQQSLREQLEKLVILDYIMRNTDRGLDNWMIKIDQKSQQATIVAEPPQMDGEVDDEDGPSEYTKHSMPDLDPYRRQEPMRATSRSATPMPNAHTPSVSLGAIDNSLSWPWKHPDAVRRSLIQYMMQANNPQWRSYPFGWLFLPVSLIGQPFSENTRRHFLPLLTSKQWWSDTQLALRKCFTQDADFKERMYTKQIAVMKGQAWNVVETLKTPDHGPLELTRRARVCVWDDLVEIPIVVPLRAPSAEMRRKQQQNTRHRTSVEHEEMDITALSTPPQKPKSDLLMNSPPLELANENRFNLSRESSSIDVRERSDPNMRGPLSPATVQSVPWTARAIKDGPNVDGIVRPIHRPRMSYEHPRRNPGEAETRRHHRRYSLTAARRGGVGLGFVGDEDEGDLGYAANEDLEGNRKKVIVERLEMVKGKNPVFSWC
ncbi:hypothetical protein K504DRAFT_487733 [Pleomassaria siparia CBS 279.74]|uniref:1-phosphatidylinositol 4-kinase n=1 Tax=Pleomassaria siparia CBS 279.74 TaxID=1314801 RepID=A0A6G1KKC9_9PLEO|nr:hypothetical protein K504DRAFT_487733 [Pleomassaria siparia CBS 279.74]